MGRVSDRGGVHQNADGGRESGTLEDRAEADEIEEHQHSRPADAMRKSLSLGANGAGKAGPRPSVHEQNARESRQMRRAGGD